MDEMREYVLAPRKRTLQAMILDVKKPETRINTYDNRSGIYDCGRPAKQGQPARFGERRERAVEPTITVTKTFPRTVSIAPSRRSALKRLEQQVQSMSAKRRRSRSRADTARRSRANNSPDRQTHARSDYSRTRPDSRGPTAGRPKVAIAGGNATRVSRAKAAMKSI